MSKTSPEEDEQWLDPYEQGRRRYQRKDYEGALDAFNQAVKYSLDHLLLNALDSRAATHEKLGQLTPALRDAKQMIEAMPKLSKGYLRCGKVLQLKGENRLALKIYERGLNKVKIGADKERTLLQKMYSKLLDSLGSGKTRDPLTYLPLELAEMVLNHLSTRDLVICLAVSKPWRKLLESVPKLWTTLDLSNTKKQMSQKSLLIHLRRSNYSLVQAIITMKAGLTTQSLSLLTQRCKQLKEMWFHGRGILGSTLQEALPLTRSLETLFIGRSTEVPYETVKLILKGCGQSIVNFTVLNVRGRGRYTTTPWPQVVSLKSIHLETIENSKLDIIELLQHVPNLTSLILRSWNIVWIEREEYTFNNDFEHVDLTNCHLNGTTFPWKDSLNLKHLILNKNSKLQMLEEAISFPVLETFGCSETAITVQQLKLITSDSIKAGTLRSLSVGGGLGDFEDFTVNEAYPACVGLEELSLPGVALNDKRAIQISGLYPNLRKLDLSSTKITGVAVRHFVESGIEYLALNECDQVGVDAVKWALAQGTQIEHRFPGRGAPLSIRDRLAGGI